MKVNSLFFAVMFSVAAFSRGVDDFDFTIKDQYSKNHNIATCLNAGMHVLLSITGTG